MKTGYDDVVDLQKKFDLGYPNKLGFLSPQQQEFRENFLHEELDEFSQAYNDSDMETALDSLVDLVVVAYGTAAMMGVTPAMWRALWDDVHRANMSKVRGQTARGVGNDLIKPDG